MEVTDLMNCPVTLCGSTEKIDSPVHSDSEDSSTSIDEILDDIERTEDFYIDNVDKIRSDFDQLPTFIEMGDNTSLFNLGLLTLLMWVLGLDGDRFDPRSVRMVKFEKSIMMILFDNDQIKSYQIKTTITSEMCFILIMPVLLCIISALATSILTGGYIVFTLLYLIYTSTWLSITSVTLSGSYLVYRLVRR